MYIKLQAMGMFNGGSISSNTWSLSGSFVCQDIRVCLLVCEYVRMRAYARVYVCMCVCCATRNSCMEGISACVK